MVKEKNYLKDISEIRSMMERSSRFISLSGLAGVFAGFFALIGASVAYYFLNINFSRPYEENMLRSYQNYDELTFTIILIAVLVLLASVSTAIILTTLKAKKQGLKIWDQTVKRLLINTAIPLFAGGIFCLALLYHGIIGLIAPATLLFYGMALLNGSKYTLNDIRYLGISEVILGVISSFFIGYGLLFWALGFGVLHIIYGTVMYFKYDTGK